ncbi:MAG: AMP-binding protein [Bryobacteraceae bacterium]
MFLLPEDPKTRSAQALYDSVRGVWWNYGELEDRVRQAAGALKSPAKSLVFCFCRITTGSIVGYLASIEAGHAVALLDEGLSEEFKSRLIALYEPEWLITSTPIPSTETAGYGSAYEPVKSGPNEMLFWRRREESSGTIYPDLALLLSTSGTTGSPKFVRLTQRNVRSNAESIRQALDIQPDHRPISSLPFHYSYGLSVLNSHLLAGAGLVLTQEGLTSLEFWKVFRELQCTSFAGVPYSYQMLSRLGVDRLNVPSLMNMTQAGGKLTNDLIARFHELMARRGGRFYVMYGQTEATARMTILPWDRLPEKLGSVGFAIPGGSISIETGGEISYTGPNVMMGYATRRADLAEGDVLGGRLATGDKGYLDEDGLLFITGRAKRDAKLFGLRVNLDEVEAMLRVHGPTAVVGAEDQLLIYCEYGNEEMFARCRKELAANLKVNHNAFHFVRIEQLPVTASGKIDYARLQK